jgi:hypothetical protein
VSFGETVLLAAFAGVTIYLGLPVGRLRNISPTWQAVLTTGAAGVILFLIYDVLAQALEPVHTPPSAPRRADPEVSLGTAGIIPRPGHTPEARLAGRRGGIARNLARWSSATRR